MMRLIGFLLFLLVLTGIHFAFILVLMYLLGQAIALVLAALLLGAFFIVRKRGDALLQAICASIALAALSAHFAYTPLYLQTFCSSAEWSDQKQLERVLAWQKVTPSRIPYNAELVPLQLQSGLTVFLNADQMLVETDKGESRTLWRRTDFERFEEILVNSEDGRFALILNNGQTRETVTLRTFSEQGEPEEFLYLRCGPRSLLSGND